MVAVHDEKFPAAVGTTAAHGPPGIVAHSVVAWPPAMPLCVSIVVPCTVTDVEPLAGSAIVSPAGGEFTTMCGAPASLCVTVTVAVPWAAAAPDSARW